jgi:hypothetical protein
VQALARAAAAAEEKGAHAHVKTLRPASAGDRGREVTPARMKPSQHQQRPAGGRLFSPVRNQRAAPATASAKEQSQQQHRKQQQQPKQERDSVKPPQDQQQDQNRKGLQLSDENDIVSPREASNGDDVSAGAAADAEHNVGGSVIN